MAHAIVKQLTRLPRSTSTLLASLAGLAVFLWPKKTIKLDYITPSQRDRYFGPIQYIAAPTLDNPEGIFITNDFYDRNIVRKVFPIIGYAQIHKLAAPSLQAALEEIERKGLAGLIRTFAGGYYPRFVRESRSTLSSHSYGTSIDINELSNPRDGTATADQTKLAPIFAKHGWYWGLNFSRPDPMHFEYVLPPKGMA